jgi:hypothetical protein
MDDHIGKPINLPRLLQALDHWTTPADERELDAPPARSAAGGAVSEAD